MWYVNYITIKLLKKQTKTEPTEVCKKDPTQ